MAAAEAGRCAAPYPLRPRSLSGSGCRATAQGFPFRGRAPPGRERTEPAWMPRRQVFVAGSVRSRESLPAGRAVGRPAVMSFWSLSDPSPVSSWPRSQAAPPAGPDPFRVGLPAVRSLSVRSRACLLSLGATEPCPTAAGDRREAAPAPPSSWAAGRRPVLLFRCRGSWSRFRFRGFPHLCVDFSVDQDRQP